MVVTDSHRITAIVIKNDGHQVTLVPMSAGRLAAQTISFEEFRRDWAEVDYSLDRALVAFIDHVESLGGTGEARRGLARLQERDRLVGSLF